MIIDKLIEKIYQTQNPTVVGLDPRFESLPGFIKKEAISEHGETLKAAAEAFFIFNRLIIDSIFDIVPAVKPQIALYEQYGASGIDAYIRTVKYAKQKGLVVIGDIKRGDISSTAEAYADGHLGEVQVGGSMYTVFDEDFITLNPYLGYDAVEPFLKHCEKYDRGLFLLIKTSNPASGDIQDLATPDGAVYEVVARLVSKWGANITGNYGYSPIGAVVGATHAAQAKRIRALMPHTFFLVPGYGAQGGSADDAAACFNDGLGAIVNSSRGIIYAYKDPKYSTVFDENSFDKASRQACLDMKDDLRKAVNMGATSKMGSNWRLSQ